MDTNSNTLEGQCMEDYQPLCKTSLRLLNLQQQKSKQNEQNSKKYPNNEAISRTTRSLNDLLQMGCKQEKNALNTTTRRNHTKKLLNMRSDKENFKQSECNDKMQRASYAKITTKDNNFYCQCCQHNNEKQPTSCITDRLRRDDMDIANTLHEFTDFSPLTHFNYINCQTNSSILNKDNRHQRYRVFERNVTRNTDGCRETIAHTDLPNSLTNSLLHKDTQSADPTSVPIRTQRSSSRSSTKTIPINQLSSQVSASFCIQDIERRSTFLEISSTKRKNQTNFSKSTKMNQHHFPTLASSLITSTASPSQTQTPSNLATMITQTVTSSTSSVSLPSSPIEPFAMNKISSRNSLNSSSIRNSTISEDHNSSTNVNYKASRSCSRQRWTKHLNAFVKTIELSKVLWICVTFMLIGLSNCFNEINFPMRMTTNNATKNDGGKNFTIFSCDLI